MRRVSLPLIFLLLLFFTASSAHAKQGPFGLGIVLGEPSGLSAKYFLDQRNALQFGLDFSFVHDAVYAGVDYLRHFPNIIPARTVAGYVGIGGAIRAYDRHDHGKNDKHDHDHSRVRARVPFGLAWMPREPSIDVFLEVVPVLDVIPDLNPGLAVGLGVRYYF